MDIKHVGGIEFKFLKVPVLAIGAHLCDEGGDLTFQCTLLQVFVKSLHNLPQLLKFLAKFYHIKLHRCAGRHDLFIKLVVIII